MSLEKLEYSPIWHRNRIFRQERAEEIAADKLSDMSVNGVPGVVTLFQAGEGDDGPHGIVDGQHRVGALKIMSEVGAWDPTKNNVLVEVFRADSEDAVAQLFTEINKAEPVMLVDMPSSTQESAQQRKVLDGAVSELSLQFPDMFSSSSRCRPPHLNVDKLRGDLFLAEIVPNNGMRTQQELVDWISARNKELGARSEGEWKDALVSKKAKELTPATLKALKKASKYGFWLGMDGTWLK